MRSSCFFFIGLILAIAFLRDGIVLTSSIIITLFGANDDSNGRGPAQTVTPIFLEEVISKPDRNLGQYSRIGGTYQDGYNSELSALQTISLLSLLTNTPKIWQLYI
jgi:hypothetical protein